MEQDTKLLQLENQVLKEQLARALSTLNYLLNSATPSQLEYNRALQEAQKSLKLEKVS